MNRYKTFELIEDDKEVIEEMYSFRTLFRFILSVILIFIICVKLFNIKYSFIPDKFYTDNNLLFAVSLFFAIITVLRIFEPSIAYNTAKRIVALKRELK